MPAVEIVPQLGPNEPSHDNSLPNLLRTPAGLAIIEIQGTIHAPLTESLGQKDGMHVGRLEFPLYQDGNNDSIEGPWMKKVHLYIGKHQRLSGEVKKLPKPLAVLIKEPSDESMDSFQMQGTDYHLHHEMLQMVAIIKYKIMFSSRPEPVGS